MTSAGNTVPMLFIRKPGTDKLRTVVDLRERNANTAKLSSPLPDIDGILRRVARKRYRSVIDGQDAYEQIRIVPEHVERSAVTTPDGNMVSEVLQQGDCNAPATYQVLMNHLFGEHIGNWLDVYLDDIIIYSDSLAEHVSHVKTVLKILEREKLFLSEGKLQFLCKELRILGRVVDDEGIRMDPDKVDRILHWKAPANRDALRSFLGAVGFLADDIHKVRVPMGVLSEITGDTVPFRWEYTHQRAFDEVKQYVSNCKDHHRVPLDYGKGAPTIWLMTDASAKGIAAVVAQGVDWKTSRVAALYSAKLSPAQQNYAVHEQEMLAGLEGMLRHRDILQGARFVWLTDHKGLVHLLNQRDVSGRQARWFEKLGEFDFEVKYIPGTENVLPDALSRMYSWDAPGTVRTDSEFTAHDDAMGVPRRGDLHDVISMPVLVGAEAMAASPAVLASRRSTRLAERAGAGQQVPAMRTSRPSVLETSEAPMAPPAPAVRGPAPRKHARVPVEPAETGRLETAAEFAKRVASRFVLRGPRERKEGEDPDGLPGVSASTSVNDPPATDTIEGEHPPEVESREHTPIPAWYPEEDDLIRGMKHKYNQDPFFKGILDSPSDYRNFELSDGLIRIRLRDRTLLCIPNLMIKGRNAREIVISQAHSLLAHLGAQKTLTYLRDHVWWKSMVMDVNTYCASCMTCKRSKPSNQKPYGLLNPLPIPSRPWESIGIDFVGPLPMSKDRDGEYDAITVIIDRLTSMVHLVPSRVNYKAREVAELIFAEVYKLHGLPKSIISDRDVLFTSTFWTDFNRLLGVNQQMSSAYHPESDGATERAN